MLHDFEHCFCIGHERASNREKGPVILIMCASYAINTNRHSKFSFPAIVLLFKIQTYGYS